MSSASFFQPRQNLYAEMQKNCFHFLGTARRHIAFLLGRKLVTQEAELCVMCQKPLHYYDRPKQVKQQSSITIMHHEQQ